MLSPLPQHVAEIIAARLRREEFEIDDDRYEQLRRHIERWRERALELARRRELRQDRGPELGREL